MKGKNIGALRQFHENGIFRAFGGVILGELCTQTASLNSDG